MKKILILAYFYPPCGGAGVQRTVKFVKYLADFGYLPIVVAGAGAKSHFHEDPELAREVAGVQRYDILFSPFEKKYDALLRGPIGRWTRSAMNAWLQAATRTVDAVIEKEKPDLLFVTTSPFPAAMVVAKASKKYAIPWILDLRDPWALDPLTHYPTKLHYYSELDDMKTACYQANAVIMNTPGALHAATSKFDNETSSKYFCITNGWDKEDFQNQKKSAGLPHKFMRIVHTGVFHTKMAEKLGTKYTPMALLRYSLNDINFLARTPNYLFAAYRKLIDDMKISPRSIQFIFAGAATPEDMALARKYQIESCVEFTGYLNHNQSTDLLANGDVLFLPLHELKDSRDPLIVPGKTYEYLATRKPILACVPEGDTRDFVLKSGLGYVCNPSDTVHIAKTLLDLFKQHNSHKGISVQPNNDFIDRFERRQLTNDLVHVFEKVLGKTNRQLS